MTTSEFIFGRSQLAASVVVAMGVLLVGCGAGGPAEPVMEKAQPSTSSSSSTVQLTSSAPTTATVELATLRARVTRAALPGPAFAELGVPAPRSEEYGVAWAVTVACNRPLASDTDKKIAFERVWASDSLYVQNIVFGYGRTKASDVIADVRESIDTCRTYTPDDGSGIPRTILGQVEIPAIAGVTDSLAYCEESERKTAFCFGFLAHDKILSVLVTVRSADVAGATNDLRSIVALGGASLIRS